MSNNMWRPGDWWNPLDYMTVTGAPLAFDIILTETGEKITTEERIREMKSLEFGADMMLNALSRLPLRNVMLILREVKESPFWSEYDKIRDEEQDS